MLVSNLYVFLYLVLCSHPVVSFNVLSEEDYPRYFMSLITKNKDGSEFPELPDDQPASFFGYNMNFHHQTSPKIMTLIVGSPKHMSPKHLDNQLVGQGQKFVSSETIGDVVTCMFGAAMFTKKSRINYCSQRSPQRTSPGDNIGLSMAMDKNGNTIACPYQRVKDCDPNRYYPGYCYRGTRGGKRWRAARQNVGFNCPVENVDLVFVLDGSQSIGDRNFVKVKSWVLDVIKAFNIDHSGNRVGIVQYSHFYEGWDLDDQPFITTEVPLNDPMTYAELQKKLEGVKLHNYTTYTAHALNKTVMDFEMYGRMGSPSTKQVMILLTDGISSDKDKLPYSASYVRSFGIQTFAVGVANADQQELRTVATGDISRTDRVYQVDNFNDLSGIVNSLQRDIMSSGLEDTSPQEHNKLSMAESGISAWIAENGRLYLGAVGAYDWSGTVTKYDTLTDNVADIPTYEEVKRVLPNRTKESYMGYSVTTGTFAGGTTEYVATGAPRYKLMGAVVIYRPVDGNSQFNDDRRLMGHPSKRKLGSYFGGSVLAVDINGDGKDDLLVGAPLYVHESFDEGRVFVYETNRGSGTLAKWESDTYAPKELVGDNLAGGRFGTAMASAGDLNKDNFNDVIIGAPLVDGDRGAVFVYHGSIDGIDTAFKQKILASQLTGVTLKYFGQSLQGGVDLDGNKYPDIAVGAPKSDTVVIFRARPVVKITPEIKFSGDSAIDIFKCIIDDRYINCSAITVCLTASGTSIEPQISLKFNVTMDTKKADADKRLEFRDDVAKSGTAKFTWSEKFTVPRNTKKCFTKQVHMKTNVNDYDSNVTAEVEYDLTPEHTAVAMSSVRDPSKSNKKSAVLQFEQNCKGSCEPDLGVTLSLNVPSYTANNDQQNDLSQSNTILIVDKSTTVSPLAGRVNLSNFGENAFGARVRIRYPPEIGWRSVKVIDSNPPSNSCIVPDSTSETENGFVTQTLRFNSKTNIMRGNSFCHFEFSLITDPLKKNGLLDNFTVQAESFLTSDTATESKDKKTGNNRRQKKIGLLYTSDMSAKEVGSSVDISFNHTRNETRNITSVREIGNGTDDIVAQFTVLGNGYSKIPVVTTTLNFPWMTEDNETLLYLFDVTCQSPSSDSGTSCLCEHANVNYLNLSTEPPVENNTSENYVTVTRRTNVMENLEYNCNNASTSVICQKVKCTIQNLGERDEVTFQASFRLWTDNLLLNSTEERARLELRSRFEVNSSPSVRIIDANGIAPIVKSVESVVTARLYKPPSTPEPAVNNLWIYILAAVGGLLLLIILVLILWKLGFFKSKYADMKKDAQEDLQEETEFPDQNGSK